MRETDRGPQLSVPIDAEFKARLEAAAAREDRPVASYVRRQPHVAVLKQSLQGKPRQISRRKTALHSQSLKLRSLRRRQPELESRGVSHGARWAHYVRRGNARPKIS